MFHWEENIVEDDRYEVLVAGGGVSGVAAALASARHGRRVLLLEKQCWLGGLSTSGLVNFWVPLCNGRGKWVIRGMAEEFLKLSIQYGPDTLPDDWKYGEPSKPTLQRLTTKFSQGMFASALLKVLHDAGVTVLFDASVSDVVMDGSCCHGVIVTHKEGRIFYKAKIVVDATGDADILLRAGVPTEEGSNYFTYFAEAVTLEGCRRALKKGNALLAYQTVSAGMANLHGKGQPEGKRLYRGINHQVLNEYLIENQLLLFEKEKDKPRMERSVHMLPGMAQFRTTRHLIGNAVLTGDEVYQHCATSIGAICDFEYRDRLYEVPYETLVHHGFDNLITCGRSASATGWGWDVLRVIPPAICTGQAAGTAAALALESSCALPQVDIPQLQQRLAADGVIIHFDDAWIPQKVLQDQHADMPEHL